MKYLDRIADRMLQLHLEAFGGRVSYYHDRYDLEAKWLIPGKME